MENPEPFFRQKSLLFAFVGTEQSFVLFVGGILYRGVWYNTDHGRRVPPPQFGDSLTPHRVPQEQKCTPRRKLLVGN